MSTEPDWVDFDDECCLDCGQLNCRCGEGLEEECHGWFDRGVFTCGAAGSEQCDECMCSDWIGLTSKEVDELEDNDDG